MKVSELAKELGRPGKDILDVLQKQGHDAKDVSFTMTSEQCQEVKKALADVPKKKIAAVYRPQNAQTMKPARPQGGRPQGGRDGRPQGARPAGQAPQGGVRPAGTRPAGQAPQGSRDGRPTGARPAGQAAPVKPQVQAITAAEPQTAEVKPQVQAAPAAEPVKPQVTAPQAETVQAAEAKPQAPQNNRENRAQGSFQGSREGREGGRAQGGFQGNREGREGGRAQGGFQGNREGREGSRTQGGFQGSREGREGGRPQGGFQGNREGREGGRTQGGFQGNREGREGGRTQGGFQGSREGREGGRAQGGFQGNREGREGGRPQGGFQGNREGREGGRTQGGFQGIREGREGGRPQGGFQGNREGGFQGGRDGGSRDGAGRGQGGRSGSQRDSMKSFDTPLATKPQSNRANKNAYKNDRYDKKNMTEDGPKNKGKSTSKHPFIMPTKAVEEKVEETIKVITIPEVLTIKELAEKMKLQPSAIVKKLFLKGTMVTINQEIDYEQAEEIAMEYEVLCEKEEKVDVIEELLKEEDEDEGDMVSRPPVVCVMGHVDHGKTSLLDAIRSTNVTSREAGGITQHIGAYVVEINGEKITFLDTPGHEAFTAMRMRGAQSTDIAVLVVAADDGVMPQTVEAINHAKAAGVEIIVAINKIDKPSANVERVKQELSEYALIPEDWGGSTIFVPVSAKTREGIEELLEMIILASEVKELKANPNRNARGLVIEAQLDKGRGPVATVLVQKGTLHVGDNVAAGACYGKVRAMMDDKGRRVKVATPSTPVEILGLNGVPNAGEVFVMTDNEKEARSFAETFISESKNKLLEETKAKLSLDDLFSQIQAGNVKELPLIVKADVQGSVEAVKQSLMKLSNEEVVIKIIHGGVGAINESDVTLASASNAIIIGFNVRPDVTAKSIAEREKVDVRLYRVIYQAIEDIEAAMKGMLDPVFEEKVIGHAIVRQLFKASGVGTIAGSYVMDGKFQRGCKVRITHEGEQVFEGALASLKRFKDDVKEVNTGYECGLVFEKFNDVQVDDMVEAYIMVEVPR